MSLIRRVRGALLPRPQAPANDPQRDPNWCFMHNMMWPACQNMH